MRSILVFDHIQYKEAREQAENMRDPSQELNAYIEFGRNWAKVGLAFARQDYEAVKAVRKDYEEFEEIEEEST